MIVRDKLATFETSIKAQRTRTTKMQKALPAVRALLTKAQTLPSMSDLVDWSPSLHENYNPGENATLSFYLDDKHKNSSLVRDLVRLTGKPARKTKESQSICATILFSGLRIMIQGYKPETCVLVSEPVEVEAKLDGIHCKYCGVPPTESATKCLAEHEWVRTEIHHKMICTPAEQVTA